MTVKHQIQNFIITQPEPKRTDLKKLHKLMFQVLPGGKLWLEDGKDSQNKTVANPTVGYGTQALKYANGKEKEYFQVGISPNTTGISVYILGLKDKTYLPVNFGKKLGKASVTGYCIKFKTLKDIDVSMLEAAMRYGVDPANR